MGLRPGTAPGYSYATLAACMPVPRDSARRDSRSQHLTDSRRVSVDSVARAQIDRRYSRDSPPPRFRAETGPSGAYTSLPSGLMVHKGAINAKDRRIDASAKSKGNTASHQAANPKPSRHRASRDQEPEQRASARSRQRKSTSKQPAEGQQARRRPFSLSSAQSKDTRRSSVKSKKQSDQKSKGKSKGMFGLGCFGL
ncbi:hypothetical protein VFPFJ_02962 [Purpureocillium lilacinum]|uniref:Uncharacterized protein n=1 Tax=Purpureocillium lilacinum TaxID=33203 RepID=A0A179HWH1_PURLI|nr:hypothetical protein VFPFJ_02962 [Purpureocillium lilacinum]OAQ93799.1 hypothetical protein VFPFJ_02962 [Purpureocillium lilacinum]